MNAGERLPVMLALACALAGALRPAVATATVYYISPVGSDANTGRDEAHSWRTFDHAFSALSAGDTLLLLDGIYTAANSGLPFAYRAFGHRSGAPGSPITIRALHERAACIDGDGSADSFRLYGLDYWNVTGLWIHTRDLSGSTYGSGLHIWDSNFTTVTRCLFAGANRYSNNHAAVIQSGHNELFEENEFYDFFRSGIDLDGVTASTFRRNYFNSRNTPDLPGGYHSIDPDRGDGAIENYPGSANIFENNISEHNATGFTTQALGTSENNLYLGNIAMGGAYGFVTKSRQSGNNWWEPYHEVFENNIAVGSASVGFYGRDCNTILWRNNTVLGAMYGFIADHEAGALASGPRINDFVNDLSVDATGIGFYLKDQTSDSSRVGYADAYGSTTAYIVLSPAVAADTLTVDPRMGSCMVYIPPDSPMRGTGDSGADIGANVLYRYRDGFLTGDWLWDPDTGRFTGCGGTVPGVNDLAGASCANVHERLHVQSGGCNLPGSSAALSASSAPGSPVLAVIPNPFREGAVVSFSLAVEARVKLAVYDAAGRRLADLTDGVLGLGRHSVVLDGGSKIRVGLPGGVYFVRGWIGDAVVGALAVRIR